MSQTSYSIDQGIAVAGLLGDIGDNYIRAYKANVNLAFGLGVVLSGTAGEVAALPASGSDKFLGVTVFSHDQVNDGVAGYKAGNVANVIRTGAVWVKVEEAVNAEDAAFVRHTAGTGTVIGSFRKSADTATAVQIAGKYLTSASANGFALVLLDL